MINFFEFNGTNSKDYGILLMDKSAYSRPERDLTYISVAGRSGDLIIDNGRYKNQNITYKCRLFAPTEEEQNFSTSYALNDIVGELESNGNYYKLHDSYNPDYFRFAAFNGNIEVSQTKYPDIVDFSLTFNCKPYLYRWDGQNAVSFNYSATAQTIVNPEKESTKPYIKVYASGDCSMSINGYSFQLYGVSDYYELDCETQNCYRGTQNKNDYFSGSFPTLKAGSNVIAFTSSAITKIEIIPRWRCR